MNQKYASIVSSITIHKLVVHIVFLVVSVALSDFFTQHRFSANVALGELPTVGNPLDFTPSCARAAGCDAPLVHAPPFQYGVLVPTIIGWIQDLSLRLTPLYGVPPVPGFHYVEVLSVFILLVVFRYYVSQFFMSEVTSSVLCIFMFYALVSLFILPRVLPLTYAIWFPWDVPSMVFFTIGLVLLYKRKLWPYYVLFAIAAMNKQTAVFLAVVYLFTSIGEKSPKSIMFHFILQIAIWMAILYAQFQVGSGNPFAMSLFDASKLRANAAFLTSLSNLPFLFSAFGYLWIPAVVFLSVIRNRFVKRSMFAIVPYTALVMLAGDVSELRIYADMAPVILIAFFHVLKELAKNTAVAGSGES